MFKAILSEAGQRPKALPIGTL